MPDPGNTPTTRLPLTGATAAQPLIPARPGMPAVDSIQKTMQLAKAGQPTYHILRTTETDAYEDSPQALKLAKMVRVKGAVAPAALAAAVKGKAPKGDTFAGTARKTAKLSKGTQPLEHFADIQDLIASLVAESQMINHQPPISTLAGSGRVAEEERNVGVSAFLYAASREADNDFHLIVGRDHTLTPEVYMTMEVSGLPPKGTAAPPELKSARNAFKQFFGAAKLPGFTYDFYDPPIPIQIEGSLFFDMTHATGGRPGPSSLKSRMPTIWEVHPLTSAKLG